MDQERASHGSDVAGYSYKRARLPSVKGIFGDCSVTNNTQGAYKYMVLGYWEQSYTARCRVWKLHSTGLHSLFQTNVAQDSISCTEPCEHTFASHRSTSPDPKALTSAPSHDVRDRVLPNLDLPSRFTISNHPRLRQALTLLSNPDWDEPCDPKAVLAMPVIPPPGA